MPPVVTAGRESVAVRVPSHAVAHALLLAASVPVAAPSANLFGRPSPTRAEHVLDDLRGPHRRGRRRLDRPRSASNPRSSTWPARQPRLLRPGGLPAEAIEAVLGRAAPAAAGAGRRRARAAVARPASQPLRAAHAPRADHGFTTPGNVWSRRYARPLPNGGSAWYCSRRTARCLRDPQLTTIEIGSEADPVALAHAPLRCAANPRSGRAGRAVRARAGRSDGRAGSRARGPSPARGEPRDPDLMRTTAANDHSTTDRSDLELQSRSLCVSLNAPTTPPTRWWRSRAGTASARSMQPRSLPARASPNPTSSNCCSRSAAPRWCAAIAGQAGATR